MGVDLSSFAFLMAWPLISVALAGGSFPCRMEASRRRSSHLIFGAMPVARKVTGAPNFTAPADAQNSTIMLQGITNIPRGGEDDVIGLDGVTTIMESETGGEIEGDGYREQDISKPTKRSKKDRRGVLRFPLLRPKRLMKAARNLVGRTANIMSFRSTAQNDVVDHSFDELDRIIESTNTTADEESSNEKADLQQPRGVESMDEALREMTTTTWPSLEQAASLLKWRKRRSFRSWVNEMELKFLSAETAKALGTVRNIIEKFSDYGVVDLAGMYSPKEVIWSIVALSRLQNVWEYDNKDDTSSHSSNHDVTALDMQRLEELAHYCIFANAAYGWKGFAFCGRWRVLGGSDRVLVRSTGIDRRDIVATNWHSKANRPAYYIARDRDRKAIVLSIRGSLSPRDILTDLCASSENFIVEDDTEIGSIGEGGNGDEVSTANATTATKSMLPPLVVGRAHRGMVDAARSVARMTGKTISDELEAHPDFSLVIVGHSLGGGVAAVLKYMWQQRFLDRVQSIGYGSPCVFPLNITREPDNESNITSVVGAGDPFATVSLGHIADATKAVSKLCQDKGLREEVLRRSGTGFLKYDPQDMTREDYDWCINAMAFLHKQMDSEKLYPPGKIYQLSGPLLDFQSDSKVNGGTRGYTAIKSVDAIIFNELKLHARMFDVTLHIPARYEMLLKRLARPPEQA